MKQVQLIQDISDLLLQFSKEVKTKGKLNLTDINIIAEDVLVPILNIVYKTSLKNLNEEKANYPGIDLASDDHLTYSGDKNNYAFQITSSNDINKIKKTLKQYTNNELYKNFEDIYILVLNEKQASYHKKSITEINEIVDGKFNFDLKKNVIDSNDLLTQITKLKPISKIQKIHKLLEDQFRYNKKSLLSLEIWESGGTLGYGFSNLINSIDLTTHQALIGNGIPNEAKDLLEILLLKYNDAFASNYEKKSEDIFKNLGYNTYLKAGFHQALNSFDAIKEDIHTVIELNTFSNKLSKSFSDLNFTLNESDFPLVNEPVDHPAIQFIKTTITQIFTTFELSTDIRNSFIKNFNENIKSQIIETFGESNYEKHLNETKDKWIKKNEKDFLIHMKNLAKLGFVEGEELEYQETYGTWQDVRYYGASDEYTDVNDTSSIKEIQKVENKLKAVDDLIEEYFHSYNDSNEGFLNNILFLIADFGKGKTSFLHHYASVLASQYLKTNQGLFPVYINLNEYDKYSNSPSLGIIANYLAKAFKIDIKEEYFKKKNYIFLIDSLDECGELTESNIDRVIKDVVEIQNLDIINQRKNRIIISSRPIAVGLKEQISKYKPFLIEKLDKEGEFKESIDNYISVYGFKMQQFDNYIEFALNNHLKKFSKTENNYSSFSNSILNKIIGKKKINLYSTLHNKVLQDSELQRPIFAYMIYKLIISNSNFIEFGKVGVYISFLNQLSRDAKHKDDINHKVSLKDEFVYRNILHASSLLWQYKRQSGEQTSLTKADICRTIDEKEIDKDDRKVLSNFEDIESIHFLSHSYLGEKENTLHFQHQSFAEILLAEYYLKIILKYAIEENTDLEEARTRLSIGLPTDETIDFFKGLLILLKECVIGNPKENSTREKRRLLIPLLASLAIKKHNKKLYSTRLNVTWFEKHESKLFSNNKINSDIIEDFPINQTILNKVEKLCYGIVNSNKNYFLADPQVHSVLYKNELIGIDKTESKLFEIDKWLALIAGNSIYNNVEGRIFFNNKVNSKYLLDMIRNWNFSEGKLNYWANDLFMGINMRENQDLIAYSFLDISGLDFSYSYIKRLYLKHSVVTSCNFSNSTFEQFEIDSSDISYTKFDEISIKESINKINGLHHSGSFNLNFCFFSQGVLFPRKLNDILKGNKYGIVNYGSNYTTITTNDDDTWFLKEYFEPLKGIFEYILSKGISADSILSSFKFEVVDIDDLETSRTENDFRKFISKIDKKIKLKKI